MERITIKGETYTFSYQNQNEVACNVNGKILVSVFSETWDKTKAQLAIKIVNELNVVSITFLRSRNIFKTAVQGGGYKPFIANYFDSEIHFEGFECGYYYPSITVDREVWEKAKQRGILESNYLKNATIIE